MADTIRSQDDLLNASTGLFKDNSAGAIGADDLRDFTLSTYRPQGFCQGRLTLESGVYLSTTDQTAKSTLYFTPCHGNLIGLYDGTSWKLFTFAEKSLSLTLTSGKNYDVFIYDNSGTLTLELSAAWTNDTTRADAIATQDGVEVKNGATTRRLLGTIRASGTNTTEFSDAKRFVSNLYNALPVGLTCNPGYNDNNSASSLTTTSGSWTRVNGGTNDLVGIVLPAPAYVLAMIGARIVNSGADDTYLAIGVDSTTVASRFCNGYAGPAGYVQQQRGPHLIPLAPGYHYLQMLWAVNPAASTSTYYADAGRLSGSPADDPLSGLFVWGML